jgi:serine/threonine protein kinase
MVGSFGEVYLVDWGVASLIPAPAGEEPVSVSSERHTRSGVRGTPAFMAPEQAKGVLTEIGERTDVFGLGALLYFVLTGHPPFEGATTGEILTRARTGLFRDPEQTERGREAPALCRIVRKAMAAVARRPLSQRARAGGGGPWLPQRRSALPVPGVSARHGDRARGRSGRGGVHHHGRAIARCTGWNGASTARSDGWAR